MIRLALRVPRAQADLVLADLLDLAPAGVEEVELQGGGSGGDYDDGGGGGGGDGFVEYAIYGAPGELPELPDLRALAGGVHVEVSSKEVPDDWAERWKRFHRPVLIEPPVTAGASGGSAAAGDASPTGSSAHETPSGSALETHATSTPSVLPFHIRPPWEPPRPDGDAIEIVIDPAQAFGTGAHATTRLCLELLLELACEGPERGAVVDVGTGSGVLAIAAAKLGYAPVLALDNDPLSVEAAKANAGLAGVAVEARRHDLRSQPLPLPEPGPAGEVVVLANLLRPLLLDLAGSLECAGGRAPDHLIASGLLREEAEQVGAVLSKRLGLDVRERRERGEWAALLLSRA